MLDETTSLSVTEIDEALSFVLLASVLSTTFSVEAEVIVAFVLASVISFVTDTESLVVVCKLRGSSFGCALSCSTTTGSTNVVGLVASVDDGVTGEIVLFDAPVVVSLSLVGETFVGAELAVVTTSLIKSLEVEGD